jgi:hypothetical protein
VGRIAKAEAADASRRLDVIYAARLTTYRSVTLARSAPPERP